MTLEHFEYRTWQEILKLERKSSAVASMLAERATAISQVLRDAMALEMEEPSAAPIGVVAGFLEEEAESLRQKLRDLQVERSRLLQLLDRARSGEVINFAQIAAK